MPTDNAWQLISEIRIGSSDFWVGETQSTMYSKASTPAADARYVTAVTTEPRSRT